MTLTLNLISPNSISDEIGRNLGYYWLDVANGVEDG